MISIKFGMTNYRWQMLLLLLVNIFSCNHEVTPEKTSASLQDKKDLVSSGSKSGPFANTSQGLDKYWYQGLAELNVFDLEQNRYKDVNPGQTLLVFVSEDFLADRQVKNDNYTSPNSIGVLKTNWITRFTTGLYDYSMMNSVFTPVKTSDFSRTLKVTHTGQDWCGQAFQQVNFKADIYQMRLFSYFENEGDAERAVKADFMEDELFNRIRMLGTELPTGEFEVIPSLNYLRLRHQPQQAFAVEITQSNYIGDQFEGENLQQYQLVYPDLQRTLRIIFQATAPYLIEGWTDSYPSAFDRKIRTTIARRKKTELLPYWELNGHTKENAQLRQQLNWGQ